MTAKLGEVKPIPSTPEGIVLRSLRPNEWEALVQTVNAGFEWVRLKIGDTPKWKSVSPPFSEDGANR